jgi:hypothetical protein
MLAYTRAGKHLRPNGGAIACLLLSIPHRKTGTGNDGTAVTFFAKSAAASRAATLDGENYAASKAGTGNAVTDLIFSMANLDVTFFKATAPIRFL